MNTLETMSDEEGLKEVWVLNLAGEWVKALEQTSSFQIFQDLFEEEGLTCSVKLEGKTKSSIYEEIDFHSPEERHLKFLFQQQNRTVGMTLSEGVNFL